MKRPLLTAALFILTCSALYSQSGEDKKHDPANAVANLEIHPELKATLFASEPVLTNPTNLDIDSRGRVWVCDVMNYRGNNGKRPEGDRILILEDIDGDGVADKHKVFYQGRDIDSAMGICVLGNKVIVSASPNVFVFTFDDNDKVTKKEVLFTKTGQPQHDHSAHSFIFGPDGRLYWNFGNTGQRVHDKNGKPVVDIHGYPVVDNGKPFFGGMPFRCEMDGSKFEVLGHNFRNNYEVAVDSFGTLWQSDNDDDGNRGVRINYVMEFGNFGYRDEMTGAGWQSPRTNMEKETPLKHWHLNDPGVVPNLLQTGQGSPTGICVYEGTLLPKVFQGQVIHCDAGPSIVRAYPVKKDGAGYSAEIVNILDGSKKNNWFRPADVCVAPDGSLFVTDWYDPGVGGHAQRDINRGRIFRVAPPGVKYTMPKFDFASIQGALEALKSPNLAVRYLAWTKLHDDGAAAKQAIFKRALGTKDDRYKARLLWLAGQIPGEAKLAVEAAFDGAGPDLAIVSLRMARQFGIDVIPLIERAQVFKDRAELRECAIALRHHKSSKTPELWAFLATKHDGKDRWYLEALGIGADKQWDSFLDAFLKFAKQEPDVVSAKVHRDIIWRSRAKKTPELLAAIIADEQTPADELPRFFRAFDFQEAGPVKDQALLGLLTVTSADKARQNLALLESAKRLKNVDVSKQPKLAAALDKILEKAQGTDAFVELVSQFGLVKHYPALLALSQKQPNQQLGVNAIKVLVERKQEKLLAAELGQKDIKKALATVQALGTWGDNKAVGLLLPIIDDKGRDVELRRQAVRSLVMSKNGAVEVLKRAKGKTLPEELKQAAGVALIVAPWKEVKGEAATLFPLPPAKNNKPLPAFAVLVKMKGNVGHGQELFAKAGTCANCHKVNGQGKDVGPDLSEIGKKLSREAILESILYPSAGISHNYETYVVELKDGSVETGLLSSNTPEAVTIKRADGILKSMKRADIEQMAKSPTSLMPADLHKDLTPQDLADITEYLLTLREVRKGD